MNGRLSFAHADLFQLEALYAITFLSRLIDEYRFNYLTISSLQRIDEHLHTQTLEGSKEASAEPSTSHEQSHSVAWDRLSNTDGDNENEFEITHQMLAYGRLEAGHLALITPATGRHLTRYKKDPIWYSKDPTKRRFRESEAFDEIRSDETDCAELFDAGILLPLARAATLLENIFGPHGERQFTN